MKRYLPLTLGVLLVALLALAPFMSVAPIPALAAVPTSIPDYAGPVSGDTVSKYNGGIYNSGIAVIPTREAEPALFLKNYSTATNALEIENAAGADIVTVGNSGFTAGMGIPIWASTSFTWTAATGFDNGTVAIVPVGQVWAINKVLAEVTTNVACTGDDSTLVVGDATTASGFLSLADAELQAADTVATAWAAGWQGMVTDTVGIYLSGGHVVRGPYIYDNSAGTVPITLTATLSESSGETITTGAFKIHYQYTRIE